MNKVQKIELINKINEDLIWLESKYEIIELPNWEKAQIWDFGSKDKDVLIFSTVLSPFEVIHVPNIKYFLDNFRIILFKRKESILRPIYPFERAEDINNLMDYLNIKEAHFCGLNEGAIAVFNLAKKHPKKVKSIVCTSIGIENVLTKFQIKLSKYFPIKINGWLVGQMVKFLSIPKAVDNFLVAYLWSLVNNAIYVLKNGVIPIYENYDLCVSSLKMPVLNIQSSPVVSDNSAMNFVNLLPKGELKYISGNSHLCMYVYSDIFNLFMEDFYKKHGFL